MKKAFTMLELVVVIVVIGIIAVAALPRINDDHIAEAADQVMSHIRYTQHLAMQDSKVGDGDKWYKKRWSITFTRASFCRGTNEWRYSVYHDDGDTTGNLNSANEVARDPLDPNKFMSSGWAGISDANCANVSSKYNLATKFGITNVELRGVCGDSNLQTISFDEFGRPMKGVSTTGTSATRGYDRLIHNGQNCQIVLSTAKKTATITVTPETGFLQVAFADRP
ncbi:prepilin-type N-terminal cleavage/methylation domain-containing protein [Campylobacter rectus]|uniref:prepilin-type N-terminal cleavage/methylation domain-containing protein n=1 Tax=Campylobacter rectus TaxID=203 RepID=UPI000F60357C|nr:prepilin-type N-terminal cleavage/methylation domain-containing protein [Campylobacter rectus]RRD52768.1 prepilin-type N-terminal cleavage/methylation domain-containing protein [Campylobacter rectus]